MNELKDKAAIITGGGYGIGREIAFAYGRAGAKVVIAARSEKPIQETVEALKKIGAAAIPLRTDVSKEADCVRMAEETLLSRVPVAPANVFRIPAENPDAGAAAAAYEQMLRKFFALQAGAFPRFDLILLGMGPDGHAASLFPGTAALKEKSRLVVANWVEKFKTFRITLTLPVLNAAHCVVFLVSGTEKAAALHEVLQTDAPGEQYPSKLVRPTDGRLIWLVDRAAASGLQLST